jgi:tRNA pseudouridine55 synthase
VPEREVTVHRLEVLSLEGGALELSMDVSKGFYVRSLARDLARALETRGHLSALRRTRSGAFELAGALDGGRVWAAAGGDEVAREEVRAALIAPGAACAGMTRVVLDAVGVANARHGRPIAAPDAAPLEQTPNAAPLEQPIALFDEGGRLVAIGERRGSSIQVVRGLRD